MAGRPPMAKMVEEDYMFSVILQHKGSRRLLPHGIGGMYSFAPIFFFQRTRSSGYEFSVRFPCNPCCMENAALAHNVIPVIVL